MVAGAFSKGLSDAFVEALGELSELTSWWADVPTCLPTRTC